MFNQKTFAKKWFLVNDIKISDIIHKVKKNKIKKIVFPELLLLPKILKTLLENTFLP